MERLEWKNVASITEHGDKYGSYINKLREILEKDKLPGAYFDTNSLIKDGVKKYPDCSINNKPPMFAEIEHRKSALKEIEDHNQIAIYYCNEYQKIYLSI